MSKKIDFEKATDEQRAKAVKEAAPVPRTAPPPAPFAVPRTYTLDDLAADEARELLSLADLPDHHGWGDELDRITGGGLNKGDFVALGASSAGAGKTAFLLQLADGLALRSIQLVEKTTSGGPLTPVLLLSELPAAALNRRTMARMINRPAWHLRAGKSATRVAGDRRAEVAETYKLARQKLEVGTFAQLAKWQRVARPQARGPDMLAELKGAVAAFKAEIEREHPGREVWPVVFVDPIQRWQDPTVSEVDALNLLAEELDQAADEEGWIVLLTSDTNKSAAKAASGNEASADLSPAGLFRGSYKLFHAADLILTYEPGKAPDAPPAAWDFKRTVTVKVAKNREGPAFGEVEFQWTCATGRFAAVEVDS